VTVVGAQPPADADIAGATRVWLLEAATPAVSSTDIREHLLADGRLDEALLPRVAEHIRRHGLYGTNPPARTLHGEH
jgi:nicotinic acid mononucleotide adenylyltransferase